MRYVLDYNIHPEYQLTAVLKSTKASSPAPEDDEVEDAEAEARLKRLEFLLKRSSLYADMLRQRMEEAEEEARNERARKSKAAASTEAKDLPRVTRAKGRKRARVDSDDEDNDEVDRKQHERATDDAHQHLEQPALITGARMKDYQLQGLAWMKSLYENGISGILGKLHLKL
jgi:ATP-dependent DNA helicase